MNEMAHGRPSPWAYPVTVTATLAVLYGFLLLVITPRFAAVWEKLEVTPPPVSAAFFSAAELLRQPLGMLAAASFIVALCVLFRVIFARSEQLIEPFLIVAVGLTVLGVLGSLYLPIFDAYKELGGNGPRASSVLIVIGAGGLYVGLWALVKRRHS